MTILEMRKWINSLPKEFDNYTIVHREYYDDDGDTLFAQEVQIVSVHIDENENKSCLMHNESYLKYKGDDIYTKIDVPDMKMPTHG
jgi:hypothetical protein